MPVAGLRLVPKDGRRECKLTSVKSLVFELSSAPPVFLEVLVCELYCCCYFCCQLAYRCRCHMNCYHLIVSLVIVSYRCIPKHYSIHSNL
jgi:hypothetical protein